MKKLLTVVTVVATQLIAMVHPSWADPRKSTHPRMPTVRTPMTRVELLSALRDGHVKAFGVLPSRERLAMAWGQVAFENGHGKYTYNHNLGNVGTTAKDQPTYYNRGDGHWYRHHETFVDGAAAYWEIVKRCATALRRFDAGDPVDAAASLKKCGYFEADLATYTRGFVALYHFANDKVFVEEQREQQRQEELNAATNDELVKLMETASNTRASAATCH